MNPEDMAGIYIALAGGVLAVVIISAVIFVERYLQRRGKVRCVVWDWEPTFFREVEPRGQAVGTFEVYLFNEMPSPTSLHGVSVVFLRDDVQEVFGRLRDSSSGEKLRVLNLPARQAVHMSLYVLFEEEEVRKLSGFQRADFVGCFPDGKTFRWKIAGREYFVASRKKVGVTRKDFVASRKRLGISRRNYARPWWRRPFAPRQTWPEHR